MRITSYLVAISAIVVTGISCSKNDPPADPCTGVTVSVSGTTTNPPAGAATGTIVATATGASGFTYSLNGGTYQSTGQFVNLAAGSYSVMAKSSAGCTGSASFTLTNTVSCNGVTIAVTPTVTGVTPCATPSANGSISVAASGGTGPYTYSFNGGAFQSTATFANLNTGTYTITAKDANGCTGTQGSISVATSAAGPLFTAVRSLIQSNCVSCHNASTANGGVNLSTDCSIVSAKERINVRAVQGTPSPMPTSGLMPAASRQAITNWLNAGGRVTD